MQPFTTGKGSHYQGSRMRRELHEIDEAYRAAQPFMEPSTRYIQNLSSSEFEAFRERAYEHVKVYEAGVQKLRQIAPSLAPEEILEAYPKVCHLLQRSLSWYMCTRFSPVYSDVMRQVIISGDPSIGPNFLVALADNNDPNIGALINQSLLSDDKIMVDRAIMIAEQLDLVDSIPFLASVANRFDGVIVELAQSVINYLQRKRL